jgi:hypothetical protein
MFKLHPIIRDIHFGTIIAPKSALQQAMEDMATFSTSNADPGVSVFMFLEQRKFQDMHDHDTQEDSLVFQIFDSNGQAHGREAFSWILDLPGSVDMTRVGSMLEAIKTQGSWTSFHLDF